MRNSTLLVIALSCALMGSGPCNMMDTLEESFSQQAQQPDSGEATDESGDPCGPEECRDTLTINMMTALLDPVNAGIYSFEVETPDGAVSTECNLYYSEAGFECYLGDTAYLDVALADAGQGIRLTMYGTPEKVNIVVEYNNWRIGEAVIAPKYEGVFLNGPECPATCMVANETMALQSSRM